jgi:signal transduction histidine kinase
MFDEKQITVNTSIPDDLIVYADQLRLEELFNNLLNNAVKYNKQRGTITIEVFRKEDFVTISVQDDGIGMTNDQLDHVFDEFYKADESRHDFDSSGLGMPICKRIVEKHGGKIWAESEGIGMGTTFYFTLPTVPSQTQFEGNTPSGDSEDDYRESISEKVDRILEKR